MLGLIQKSSAAILAKQAVSLCSPALATRVATQMATQSVGPFDLPGIPFTSEADSGIFTKRILDAIDDCKAALMVKFDHLVSERTLSCHDLDKIRSCLTTAEGRISDVEDSSSTHTAQLSELQDLVRALKQRSDDTEEEY